MVSLVGIDNNFLKYSKNVISLHSADDCNLRKYVQLFEFGDLQRKFEKTFVSDKTKKIFVNKNPYSSWNIKTLKLSHNKI